MHEEDLENGISARGGEVGRRDFLKIAIGAGLAVVAAGCSPPPPPAAQPTSAPAATAAAPAVKPTAAPAGAASSAAAKPTGTLTVAIPAIGNPAYIPSRLDGTASKVAIATLGESLLSRKEDGTIGTQLAENWSVSPDGKTLTFDLRKGIRFHDGSELTSADVKFTFEQSIRPDSIEADAAFWRDAIDRIETPTLQRVVMYLKERNITVPFKIAAPRPDALSMFSKSYIEKLGEDAAAQKPVGTGPWKLVEFRPGELIRFEAVENHWRQTPALKELIMRQVPEESTRVAMVLRGEADLVQVGVGQMKALQQGGANLFTDPASYILFITLQGQYLPSRPTFDPKVPWWADPADNAAWERARKVRQAMNLAIDRKRIIDTILAGQGVLPTYMYSAPGSVFEDPSWKPVPYDPARAKQLLAEAGYPNGFEFPLMLAESAGRSGAPEVGEAVAQYWQAIGLRPKLQRADFNATARPGIVNRTLNGVAVTAAVGVYGEPVIGAWAGFTSMVDLLWGCEYPPLDDLTTKANATPDFEQRKALTFQIGKMVQEEYLGAIPIAWVNGLWGGSKKIKAFPRLPGLSGLYNFEYVTPIS